MRIIAGQWRGRKLTAPLGDHTRPTSERAREALFSMLLSRLGSFEDLRVMDLCAGTGALGLEALSRGATHVCFVENDAGALQALKKNIALLKAEANTQILQQDARKLGQCSKPYHVALLDPPYQKSLVPKILERLAQGQWLEPGALVSAEMARDENIDMPDFEPLATRTHGKAALHVLRYMPTTPDQNI